MSAQCPLTELALRGELDLLEGPTPEQIARDPQLGVWVDRTFDRGSLLYRELYREATSPQDASDRDIRETAFLLSLVVRQVLYAHDFRYGDSDRWFTAFDRLAFGIVPPDGQRRLDVIANVRKEIRRVWEMSRREAGLPPKASTSEPLTTDDWLLNRMKEYATRGKMPWEDINALQSFFNFVTHRPFMKLASETRRKHHAALKRRASSFFRGLRKARADKENM